MSEEKWYPEFSRKYVLKDDCLIAIGPEKFITVAEIKRLYAENADLKARLIEGPKKKLVMCERCKVVTDWYGLDRACKCGCPSFSDLNPKPQGEE